MNRQEIINWIAKGAPLDEGLRALQLIHPQYCYASLDQVLYELCKPHGMDFLNENYFKYYDPKLKRIDLKFKSLPEIPKTPETPENSKGEISETNEIQPEEIQSEVMSENHTYAVDYDDLPDELKKK